MGGAWLAVRARDVSPGGPLVVTANEGRPSDDPVPLRADAFVFLLHMAAKGRTREHSAPGGGLLAQPGPAPEHALG